MWTSTALFSTGVGRTSSNASGVSGISKKLQQKGSTPRQRLTRSNTLRKLHNKGAAGDIEQHVETDETNHTVHLAIDVRVRKESKKTEEEVQQIVSELWWCKVPSVYM